MTTSTLPLLDPRNDLVFKMLFANSLPLLSDLINAVRIGEPPVQVESVENPRLEALELTGKFIVLDILAKDQEGHFYNIEMQMSRREQWSARSMVYLARTLAGQLKSGKGYATLKPVIGIHLLSYDLFEDQTQALWCFEMRDRVTPSVRLGGELQLNIVELSKADKLAATGALSDGTAFSALRAWIMYFEHWKEEHIMSQIAYPPVQAAMDQLKALSADEDTRRLADVRERAMISERTEIEAAILRGKTEGKEVGRAEGKAEGKAEALRCLIESGIPEAQARAILHM